MVIFLRHGETVFNKDHKFQGVSDSPLTDQGVRQAKAMGTFLTSYRPSRYIISPLPRVYQTYTYIRESATAPCEVNPILSEISYGAWEGVTKQQAMQDPLWNKREADRFSFVHPGAYDSKRGESYKQLYDRLESFFSELFSKYGDENVAIIAHQGVMVCAKKYFENISDAETSRVRVPNDVAVCISKKSEAYTVTEKVITYGR